MSNTMTPTEAMARTVEPDLWAYNADREFGGAYLLEIRRDRVRNRVSDTLQALMGSITPKMVAAANFAFWEENHDNDMEAALIAALTAAQGEGDE